MSSDNDNLGDQDKNGQPPEQGADGAGDGSGNKTPEPELSDAQAQQIGRIIGAVMDQRDAAMEQRVAEIVKNTMNDQMEAIAKAAESFQGSGQAADGGEADGQAMTSGEEMVMKLLGKWLGGDAKPAQTPAEVQIGQLSNMMNMINTSFLKPQLDAMQVGMQLASGAYGFQAKVTGQVPDPAAFNQQFKDNIGRAGAYGSLAEEVARLSRINGAK